MKLPRIDIARIRREQIVDAAVAVIAEKGLQKLSLSEIEKKVGMSRGQLTYYFKAKEEILLAVFDRLLQLMCQRHEKLHEKEDRHFLEIFEVVLRTILRKPPSNPEFHALQFTFLSQIGHREDFRKRLADLYEEWRSRIAEDLTRAGIAGKGVSPRAFGSLMQAILHGLAVQSAADPDAFDAEEMVELSLEVLRTFVNSKKSRKRRPNVEAARSVATKR
jgi:AcrR family transcriptional regulator